MRSLAIVDVKLWIERVAADGNKRAKEADRHAISPKEPGVTVRGLLEPRV